MPKEDGESGVSDGGGSRWHDDGLGWCKGSFRPLNNEANKAFPFSIMGIPPLIQRHLINNISLYGGWGVFVVGESWISR